MQRGIGNLSDPNSSQAVDTSVIMCPICKKELPPNSNLSFHMMLHPSEKPFPCDFCLVSFATKEDLKDHLKEDHVTERTHICEICSKVFSFAANLKRHNHLIHSDSTRYQCVYCDVKFREYGRYRLHETLHDTETDFQCDICNIYFISKKSLDSHKVGCGSKVLKCCKLTFASRMDFVHHTVAKHKRYKQPSHKCNNCGKAFMYTYMLKVHEEQCGKVGHPVKKIETDSEGHPLVHECETCSRTFDSRHGLNMHKRTHPRDPSLPAAAKQDKFRCTICGKELSTQTSLVLHKARHLNAPLFYCQYCNKGFYTRAAMTSHEVVHTKEKRYNCKYCSKAFSYKTSMKAHQRIHTGERPFPCRYCERSFTRFGGRQSHERLHTGERPFTCKVCHKTFAQDATWRQHERTHNKTIECNCCGRSFATRKECKEHVRLQREITEIDRSVQNDLGNPPTKVTTSADGNVYMYYQLP